MQRFKMTIKKTDKYTDIETERDIHIETSNAENAERLLKDNKDFRGWELVSTTTDDK